MARIQAHRTLSIATPLGEDVLLLTRLNGTEELGRPFEYSLRLVSEEPTITFEEIVGQNVTIRLRMANNTSRYFNGFISRFKQLPNRENLAEYEATMVPWFWFLTRTADCRIFQKKTVPTIIEEVFGVHKFSDYKLTLSGQYREWEYCVQYRETDLNFLSRLMEQEGIYYYFTHENGKHTMIIADSIGAHEPHPDYKEIKYRARTAAQVTAERIWEVTAEKSVLPGNYVLNDFDFKNPKKVLRTNATLEREHAYSKYEIFDYPGEYMEYTDGENYVRSRLEELQCQHELIEGTSNARGIGTGHTFTLTDFPLENFNREYLITATQYVIESESYESAATPSMSDGENFMCQFTAIDRRQPFRSERITPKPLIRGPQTAIVVGKSGEEIHTDEYGRVMVQFHWDRYSQRDENSSCWIRVSNNWAGNTWGGIFIPRIGQEVIVEFLEGDPDQPIITGRVYNQDNMPPYTLPADKTKSTIKSNSSKGGLGFNELRFEDKKGSEEVYIHAEKDWKIDVKNCESETVGSNISTQAGGNISRGAGKDISRTADDNIIDKAGKEIQAESGKDMKLKSSGSYQLLTNMGIHLKAMNYVGQLIESGAKQAAGAVAKGAGGAAASAAAAGAQAAVKGGDAGAAAGTKMAEGGAATGMKALAALSPGIEAGAQELTNLANQAAASGEQLNQPVNQAISSADQLGKAIESGASPELIAGAVMALASAVASAFGDAKKLVEGLLPQIPSIELWAMKDVNAHALWSMSLSTKVRDISIEAQNRHVNVKAKQSVNIEAASKDLSIKATKKKVLITGKEEVNVKAEDKNLVLEAGKKKVMIKSPDQIFLKAGSASISLAKSGNIVIKGAKINIKGSGAVTVKGTPIKLN